MINVMCRPALARARMYRFLARLFSTPAAPVPRQLTAVARRTGAGQAVTALAAELAALGQGGAMHALELRVEHCRLFHGPGAVPVPLYESVYRDQGVLMGPSTLAVLESYQEAGLALDPAVPELPDHLCMELGFLHDQSLREALALRSGQGEAALVWAGYRRAFVADHLAAWVSEMVGRLQAADPSPHYAAAGALLAAWVEAERAG